MSGPDTTGAAGRTARPATAPDRSVRAGRHVVRGEIAGVSVRAALTTGAIAGFAVGLVLGGLAGALVVWFAGAVLDWQRELSLTLGIARTLLPFSEQTETLRAISQRWILVIPVAALVGGALIAVFGALVGALIAAVYDRSTGRRAGVLLSVDDRADGEESRG